MQHVVCSMQYTSIASMDAKSCSPGRCVLHPSWQPQVWPVALPVESYAISHLECSTRSPTLPPFSPTPSSYSNIQTSFTNTFPSHFHFTSIHFYLPFYCPKKTAQEFSQSAPKALIPEIKSNQSTSS